MVLSEMEWTEKTIATSFQEIWDRYGEEIVDGTYHIDADERRILEEIFRS